MDEIVYDIKKKYNELDEWIATLEAGTYNVEVDCTGVAADQFIGNDKHPGNASPFGEKLKKAKSGVLFNLKFGFPDEVTDASCCFHTYPGMNNVPLKSVNISSAAGVTKIYKFLCNSDYLTSVNLTKFIKVIHAEQAFGNCSGLTSVDCSGFVEVTYSDWMFQGCTGLTSITGTEAFANVTKAQGMFNKCSGLTSIDTKAFTQVTDASHMFKGCIGLTSIDTQYFTQVTDTSHMFNGCKNLRSIDLFNCPLIQRETFMFYGCISLTNVNWGDLVLSTNPGEEEGMFEGCTSHITFRAIGNGITFINEKAASMSLKDYSIINSIPSKLKYNQLDKWIPLQTQAGTCDLEVDCTSVIPSNLKQFGVKISKAPSGVTFNLKPINITENFTDASSMFYNCSKLTSIDTSGFTNITNAQSMFRNCTGLTSIDCSAFTKVTDANSMFYGCTGLTSIDTSAFTQVTNTHEMFINCTGLTSIDTSAFTKVTNATRMFAGCLGLTSIDTSPFTKVTDASYMFANCSGLVEITIGNKLASLNNSSDNASIYNDCTSLSMVKCKGDANLIRSNLIINRLNTKFPYEQIEKWQKLEEVNDKGPLMIINGDLKVNGKINGGLELPIGSMITINASDEKEARGLLPKYGNWVLY